MGIKHRVVSADFTLAPNGSRVYRTPDAFASVVKVENCPCEDGVRRTAYATAEADTFFTIPAMVSVANPTGGHSKTVSGHLESDEDGWKFTTIMGRKNAALIKKEGV